VRSAALVLAAGSSSRLGRPKQLVLVDGEPLLRRTVRIAGEAGFSPVYVVLGAEQEGCRIALAGLDVAIIHNPRWTEGMGSSLRRGIQELSAEIDAVLLLVCDQPRLTSAALLQLRELHERSGRPMTAAQYSGRVGVPAIFSRALFAELAQVAGDQGARAILAAHREEAACLDLPEGACDIDTAADLAALESGVEPR
jgi:molybdenum cofactor cytidylyltransferase